MKTKKRFLSILLSLVMVLGLMPGMSLTALAWDGDPYASLLNTTTVVNFDGKEWYLIENNSTAVDAGTVTLFSKEKVSTSVFGSNNSYSGSTVETAVNNYYADNISTDAKAAVNGGGMFLLTTTQANALTADVRKYAYSNNNDKYWWLCSQGVTTGWVAIVEGQYGDVLSQGNPPGAGSYGVRPALKLDLSKVSFDSASTTFSLKVNVTGVTLNPPTATLTVGGDSVTLTATVEPADAMDKTVTWTTSDANVATVANGVVTAQGAGTATITATATNGTADTSDDKTATCAVTVTEPGGGVTAPTSKVLSGNGQPQPLVNAGTVSGGTLEYALGTDANTAPADGWSTEIPTATEAGTYYVWYRIKGDANHNDVAPACIVVTIEGSASDYTLLASMKTSGNKAFTLKWTAVTGAEGYDVFFGRVGKKAELKTSVNGTSCKIKKLKRGIAYKAFVKAWKTENGQKVYIGEASPVVYAITGGQNNRYTNPKKITVKKKTLTVAVGGSKKIKASLKKLSNSRRYLNHTAKIRYFSSNRAVATVNAKGKVTGVAPGTCTVYAVAENGLRKGVKITVK